MKIKKKDFWAKNLEETHFLNKKFRKMVSTMSLFEVERMFTGMRSRSRAFFAGAGAGPVKILSGSGQGVVILTFF